jgi:hypothetical protein
VGPRAGLDAVVKRKIPSPPGNRTRPARRLLKKLEIKEHKITISPVLHTLVKLGLSVPRDEEWLRKRC